SFICLLTSICHILILCSGPMIMFVFYCKYRAQMFPNRPDANRKRTSWERCVRRVFEGVLLESTWGAVRRLSTKSWELCKQHGLVCDGWTRSRTRSGYIELFLSWTGYQH
ncbi:hypothetical protein EV421DRAFT_1822929, partial [Armillaria borealis]